MAVRSLQSHVETLLSRRVVEDKTVGVPNPDVEARALLESIALNLLLAPKSVLYLALLARNLLANAVASEIAALDTLSQTIRDLANTVFTETSSESLDSAKVALLQLEGLDKIDTSSSAFQKYNSAVDDFLNNSLGKTVRRVGATDLVRSDVEASADLPTDFESVLEFHTDLLDRLYSLMDGVENFTSSPLSTILGLTTAYRVRQDLEDIIDLVNTGQSGIQARDIATRLIGSRASLKTVGSLPSLSSPVLDTTQQLPVGYSLKGQSDPASAIATGSAGPFVFGATASATVTVNGDPTTATIFPQFDTHLDNRAFVVSGVPTYPATIPVGYSLYLHLIRLTTAAGYTLQTDGTYLKQLKLDLTSGSRTFAQVKTDLNTALGADGLCTEYVQAGTNQLLIIINLPVVQVSIVPLYLDYSIPTVPVVFSNSAHALLGFSVGQVGNSGTTPVSIINDAFNLRFPSITSIQTSDGEITLQTVVTTPGTSLAVSTDASLGLNGTFKAQSAVLKLYGTVAGTATDPVDPTSLVDVGDTFEAPTGSSVILSLSTTRITLVNAVETFDGNVTCLSDLYLTYQAFAAELAVFLESWFNTPYTADLKTLDQAVAALAGKSTPATRNTALNIISNLRSVLDDMQTAINTWNLENGSATKEKGIINGIISSLTEKGFNRAADFLVRMKIQEFFEMTGDTASFGGALMSSISALATTDVLFPNTELDEDNGLKANVQEPEA